MARRIGLALGLALGLVLLLILAVFGLAQTAPGKRLLAEQVERALTGPEMSAEVSGLDGFLPFDLRLARFALADGTGPWLELTDLHVSWSPRALLHGRLEIEDVSAAALRLQRLPPSAPEETTDDAPFRLPELPESLPPVTLERLAFERIEIGPEVLGQAASFTLAGRLATTDEGRGAALTLEAKRLDQATAQASIDARLDLSPAALDLTVSASETGGLLAALTQQPQAGDFSLKLKGAGPLDGWSGDLELVAEGLAHAAARLDIALADAPTVRLDAKVEPDAAVVPADLAPLIGEQVGLALTVRQTAAQHVVLRNLAVEVAAATLSGAGDIDFDSEQFAAQTTLRVPDLAPLGRLIETPLTGSLQADLAADGALMQPKGKLEIALEQPGVDQVAAERITTALDFAALAPLDGEQISVEVKGDGKAQSLRLPEGVPLPAQDVTWRVDASGSPDGPVTLRELALAADHVALQASGAVDAGTLAGDAKVGLRVDALAPLTEPFGQPIAGQLALDADLQLSAQAEQVTVDLKGGAQALAGLPPGAAELLGPAPQLAAQATFRPAQGLEVRSLTLDGAATSLKGQLALSLPEQGLGGEVTLSLPKLAVLGPALQQDIAGAIEIVARPGGTLEAPSVDLRVDGKQMLLAGRAIERLTLQTAAHDLLSAPAGHLEASLRATGLVPKLVADYALEDQELKVSGLALTGPGTRVGGDLALDLERTLIDGTLDGQVDDLAAFAPLLPVALAGRLTLKTRLAPAAEGQAVDLTLDGSGLQGDFGSLQRLGLRAKVANALAAPQLDADLEIDSFRQGATVVDRATLGAEGTLEALTLTLSANGEALKPFNLDSRAQLALGEAIRLRLEQLQGRFADQPLRLAQPAELTLADGRTQVAGLDLRYGDARLQASADLGPQQVSADATLAGLPLGLFGRFGAPSLSGTAGARLQLSGAADNPNGTFTLDVEDMQAEGLTFAELPPARFDLDAQLAARRVTVDLQGEGLTEQPMTLHAEVPLVVRLDQYVFELPADGQISGRVDAELALERIAALAALEDQTLSGALTVHGTVAGTVGEPQVQGSLDINDGAYANGETGTVLKDMVLAVRANAEQARIERFSATDGGNGTLSASGTVGIAPASGFPIALQAGMKQARLVRRDDVDATVSGALTVNGDASAMTLGGNVTVNRANVQIPDDTGPSVAVISVEEVGVDGVQVPSDQGGEALALDLDLAVNLPERVFVRGRGLEFGMAGQAAGDRPGERAADRRRVAGQARLHRFPRPPPAAHRRRDQLRRRDPARSGDRDRGHDQRGRHDRAGPDRRAGAQADADPRQRPDPAAGRDPRPAPVPARDQPDDAGASGPARACAQPAARRRGRPAGQGARIPACRHARFRRRRDRRGEHGACRQVSERRRLCRAAAGGDGRNGARPGRGRDPAERVGRGRDRRQFGERRRHPVAL